MSESYHRLSMRYAKAFLNIHEKEIDDQFLDRLRIMILFLKKNRWFYYYLGLTNIGIDEKWAVIEKLEEIFGKFSHLSHLIKSLVESNRINLLGMIIHHTLRIYDLRQNKHTFTIWTSHSLDANEQQKILDQLHRKVLQTINATFKLDPTLICGIKIRSDQLFFERSIAQKLKNFEQSLLP